MPVWSPPGAPGADAAPGAAEGPGPGPGGSLSRCNMVQHALLLVTRKHATMDVVQVIIICSACCHLFCPSVSCSVSSWSPWRSCSKSCGSGTRSRSRSVTIPASCGGAACPGLSVSRPCNTHVCPGILPSYMAKLN